MAKGVPREAPNVTTWSASRLCVSLPAASSNGVDLKGLRPRYAAYVIVAFWSLGVVVFGIVERLVDPRTFDNVWLAMWWGIQTVTTVGYGDVVPGSTAGKVIGSFMVLGGLSLFAVVTGAITTALVAQAQKRMAADPMTENLDEVAAELKALKADLARLERRGD
jgi:voltage-gated potassium channel